MFWSIDSYFYRSLPFYYSYSFLCSFVTHTLLFLFSVLLGSWINILSLSCTYCDANSWMEVVNSTFHHSRRNFYHFMQGMNGIILQSLPCTSIIDKWIISFITLLLLFPFIFLLVYYQDCALAERRGPWHLTFALGRLGNLSFFIQIICWAP